MEKTVFCAMSNIDKEELIRLFQNAKEYRTCKGSFTTSFDLCREGFICPSAASLKDNRIPSYLTLLPGLNIYYSINTNKLSLHLDRLAMQDASAQTAILQFMLSNLPKTAGTIFILFLFFIISTR